jgi:acyl-CoA reductase-like NAD-dependent aldehyde dehydrogenase
MADKQLQHHPSFVSDGIDLSNESRIQIINPATEEPLATIDNCSESTVAAIVQNAIAHFKTGSWATADASTRYTILSKAATLLRTRLPELIPLEVAQTGRPIREMTAQLARVPEWLEYFASLARTHEGRVTPFKGPVVNTLTRSPLGVVVQITPWNHPLLIATKKIGAALAAGNTVIVKPSELAPLSVLMLGEILREAGLPEGTLSIVNGYGREAGRWLCESRGIAKIDLTGGLQTYRAIAPVAAANMVGMTAELGGKAAVCIFPSIGKEKAVKAALFAGFIASGQTCVTGSRILVHTQMWGEFVGEMVKRTSALRIGDPTEERTQIGCVIGGAAVERCEGFVKRAVEQGGRVLCGGKATQVGGKGFFFEPTLIQTTAETDLSCNEVFGPIIALIRCEDEEEIIKVANGTSFALGTSVWTNDFAQAHRVADKIEAGIVWINGHHLNDPSSPWGGFKESGMGKENGVDAYESYTKVKSTVINYGQEPTWFDDDVVNARYG